MSAHSPGPWKFGTEAGDEWFTDAKGASVFMADPENRRLVENAPEMLELLREHQWCEDWQFGNGDSDMPSCRHCGNEESEGHAADCRLGSLLKRIDGQGQE